MNVYLGPELDRFVGRLLKTGMYQSQSEVLREALRLLKQQEAMRKAELEALRAKVRTARQEIDRGEYIEVDSSTFATIREAASRRSARNRKAS